MNPFVKVNHKLSWSKQYNYSFKPLTWFWFDTIVFWSNAINFLEILRRNFLEIRGWKTSGKCPILGSSKLTVADWRAELASCIRAHKNPTDRKHKHEGKCLVMKFLSFANLTYYLNIGKVFIVHYRLIESKYVIKKP